MNRRNFLLITNAALLTRFNPAAPVSGRKERAHMYGLIVRVTAVPSKRDALIAILIAGATQMPGCLSYVVAKDSLDANAIWITEVWDSEESHSASLSLPGVKDAISHGKPLIAEFGRPTLTQPVGGYGLATH